jgi:hypothetical protein
MVAALIVNTVGASAAQPAPDLSIVTDFRQLSAAEVRSHDVTDSERGIRALDAESTSLDVNRRAYRVFAFDDLEVVVDATTTIAVVSGRNRAGELVYDVLPEATGAEVVGRAGYAVPPSSAWKYNNDGTWTTTVGTWKRTGFWTLTKANDYKTSSTATAYDYWRVFVKMQAATLTGSASNEGFKRAWVEIDRTAGGTSPTVFEVGKPEESYPGKANQTVTVGFGTSFSVNLGIPPLTASGGTTSSYSGSMTKSSENWHPVVRSESGSGIPPVTTFHRKAVGKCFLNDSSGMTLVSARKSTQHIRFS